MTITVHSFCYYFSDPDRKAEWRDHDYKAYKLVKIFKGEKINGHFNINIGDNRIRIDNSNAPSAVLMVATVMANFIKGQFGDNVTIVPIPNSHVTKGVANFRTLELACAIAEKIGGDAQAEHILCWRRVMQKSHAGGTRDKRVLYAQMDLIGRCDGRHHILFDDVCTTGAHFVAAAAKLRKAGATVPFGICLASTTDKQHDKVFVAHQIELQGVHMLANGF